MRRKSQINFSGHAQQLSSRAKASVGPASLGQAIESIRLTADPVSKRLFDLVLASLGLLVTAPLWVLIGLFIWLEDGRPVLLLQERVGREGRLFKLFKFRTMTWNTRDVEVIEDQEHDPRVTVVGRFLRATGLDELPQILNILKGHMSLVGPRALPLRVEDHERTRYRTIQDIEGYKMREMVRPGITGIAQVFAPKAISRRMKFRYDLLYVKKWSFWLDIKLVALSIWITLRGNWESRDRKV